jgi:PD-(D/E)XK nuclease superfamily
LSIPNREVRRVYTTTFQMWMDDRLKGKGGSLNELTAALFTGDAERLEPQLQAFVTSLLGYHDTGLRPEQVYQAFLLGLLASLEPEYQVRSNRESGHGRPDVLIRPVQPGKPGVVLELKVVKPSKRTPDKALGEAMKQIAELGYAAELSAAGASPIHAFAIAFDGKRVWVRAAAAAPKRLRAKSKRRKAAK